MAARRCLYRNISFLSQSRNSSTSQTAVFTWGVGTGGQLGHQKFILTPGMMGENYTQLEPRRMVKSKHFVDIACGTENTFGVTDDGLLFGWGNHFAGKESKSNEPVLIQLNKKIVSVNTSGSHSACIDEDGQVYTWGEGGSWLSGGGQLGHGNNEYLSSPKLVQAFLDCGGKAIDVGCGGKHSVILTDDGEVLSCGVGEYGRLGTGDTSDESVPVALDTLEGEVISQIAVGDTHTLALSDEGLVYSWGRNDMGQLGHGDTYMDIYSMENLPRAIQAFSGIRIVHVSAGKGRSAVATEAGEVYVWGGKLSHTPVRYDKSRFGGSRVTQVACGGDASMAGRHVTACVTDDGALWTFGGKPLLGHSGSDKEPVRVPHFHNSNMKVERVFCGPGVHMAAIVRVEM